MHSTYNDVYFSGPDGILTSHNFNVASSYSFLYLFSSESISASGSLPSPQHDYSVIFVFLIYSPVFPPERHQLSVYLRFPQQFIRRADLLSLGSFKILSHYTKNQPYIYITAHSTSYNHNHPLHRVLRSANLVWSLYSYLSCSS